MPSIWVKAIINPIPKGAGKDPFVPLNYRGISLLSCMSKTFTSLLNERIVKYCDDLGILADEQNGFRKGRSCVDHLFSLTSIIRNRLANRCPTFCAFIDMEKAFDWVDRDLLLYRLSLYQINGKIYKSIKMLYTSTMSCVRLNNIFGGWFLTNTGVRQGDNLSPTLFALFINGLAEEIKTLNKGVQVDDRNVAIMLYADDIICIANNEVDLQCMIECMYKWCYKWKLKLNIEKSNIVHFRTRRQAQTKFQFQYGDKEFKKVDRYKYLGMFLDAHLSFNDGSKILSEAGGRALGGVINKFKELKDCGFDTYEKMFNTAVSPVCNYAAEIWGYKDFSWATHIQNRAMRYYLGVHRFACLGGLRGDFGWLSPRFQRFIIMVNFWNRLINMGNDRLTKHMFEYDHRLCSNNWCSEIKDIFVKLGMVQIFNQKLTCDLTTITNKLYTLMKREWLEEIQSKPKLRTYMLFKEEFGIENYVKFHMSKRNRSLLAQFRLGILPLNIEIGRYSNMPVNERLCKLCNTNNVENEYHFLLTCPVYKEIRQKLFNNISRRNEEFSQLDTMQQFVKINTEYHKFLALYLNEAWQKRQSVLYTSN